MPGKPSADESSDLLLPLGLQVELLRRYNEKFWRCAALAAQLKAVDTKSKRPQKLEEFEVLHVDRGTRLATFEFWMKAIRGIQGDSFQSWPSINPKRLCLSGRNARAYRPGVQVVRLQLPQGTRSVHTLDEVWQQAAANRKVLAHAEGLAAFALHPELLRRCDGRRLPNVILAGYMTVFRDREGAPSLFRAPDRDQCGIDFQSGVTPNRSAALVVLKR